MKNYKKKQEKISLYLFRVFNYSVTDKPESHGSPLVIPMLGPTTLGDIIREKIKARNDEKLVIKMEPLTLDEQAAQEIMQDLTRIENKKESSIVIPVTETSCDQTSAPVICDSIYLHNVDMLS